MKDLVKLIGVNVIRLFLRILFVFSVKDTRIVFISYQGKQYSCNPRFIYEELFENYGDEFEYIWAFREPQKFSFLENGTTVLCKFRTWEYYRYVLTAKVVVVNTTMGAEIPKRKKQFTINTWHGGGNGGKRSGGRDDKTLSMLERRRNIYDGSRYQLLFTSSQTSLKNTVRGNLQHTGLVIGGTPRNDILINKNADYLYDRVRKYFNLDANIKIALYAPTYRNQKSAEAHNLDYNILRESLEKRFGGEWAVLIRMHYFVEERPELGSAVKDASAYMDMQDLLYVVDVLITDYSSSSWDFTFTWKPCFLYCPDLKNYIGERDFYSPITSWGYPVCENNLDLQQEISKYNKEMAVKRLEKCHTEKGSFEEGHASRDAAKVIAAVCRGQALPEDVQYVK